MPKVYVTGFRNKKEAKIYASALEFVNDSSIEVLEVGDTYVLFTDKDQDGDMELGINREIGDE
jgi:hypothetical protein